MPITLDGTLGITTPGITNTGNESYAGTLTGGTGVINIGSGQFYKDSSGNVGIGTSSPASYGKLTVWGGNAFIQSTTASVGAKITLSDTNNSAYISSAPSGVVTGLAFGIGSTEAMRITSTGAVCIGTTTASNTLTVAVQAAGAAGLASFIGSGNGSNFSINSSYTGAQYFSTASAGDTTIRTETNNLNIGSATGVLRFGSASNEWARFDASGNFGLGTPTPNAKLEVYNGRIRVNSSADPGIEFANISAVKGYVYYDTTNDIMVMRHASGSGFNTDASGNLSVPSGTIRGQGAFVCYFTGNINANTNTTPGVIGSYASGATNAPDNSGILWNGMGGNNASNGYVSPNDGGQFWQNYNNNAVYNRKRWGGGYGAWVYIGG